ncbi:MAG: hypothetical protein J0L88_05330 [Xanthomonadales bacterium]|nr:hypothetical protein [Xanthomonadales bacterium]
MNHDEHEWQAQETALRALRDGSAGGDAGYRRVIAALRDAPAPMLPAGFAAVVARHAEAQAAADRRFERQLAIGLGIAFAVGAIVALAVFGRLGGAAAAGQWSGSLHWLFAAAVCVGVTALMPKPRASGSAQTL